MRRTAARRAVVAITVAYLFGWVTGRLPAPGDPAEFWIGNLGAPYLVIGFVAGAWVSRRTVPAMIAGSACVAAPCSSPNRFSTQPAWTLASAPACGTRPAYTMW